MTASPTVEELLTESAAVARIPGRDADVRAWLRGLGIARRGPTGVRLYLWSEVCAALPREEEPAAPCAAPDAHNAHNLGPGPAVGRGAGGAAADPEA